MGKRNLIISMLFFGLMLILLAGCETAAPEVETLTPTPTASAPGVPEEPEPLPTITPTPTELISTPTPEVVPETGTDTEPAETPLERSLSSPLAGVDACEIYPQEEAEAALQKPVREPENLLEAEAMFSVTSCFYSAEEDQFEYTGIILVAPADGNVDFSRATFEYSRQEAGNLLQIDPVDVANLGDGAYWVGGEIRTLFVLQESVQLHLTQTNETGGYPSPEMIEQAERILERLP